MVAPGCPCRFIILRTRPTWVYCLEDWLAILAERLMKIKIKTGESLSQHLLFLHVLDDLRKAVSIAGSRHIV